MPASSKISSTRFIRLAGKVKGKIVTLPLLCVRKNCIRKQLSKTREYKLVVKKKTELLGMVSHPSLYKSKTAPYIDVWCHPYREPDDYLTQKPRLLLSESDFVDPQYIHVYKKTDRYDYFYFTMGGRKAKRRKGYGVFMKMLPYLCKKKLRGLVINYTRKPLDLDRKEKRIWRYSQEFVKYRMKKYTPSKVAKIMASCKFGIFPNLSDCSPLLVTESLVRSTPVLVNNDILGGWKYVNENTGVLFTQNNISESIDKILSGTFSPREDFLSKYGFYSSAKKLADFGRKHLKSFKRCELACFQGASHILGQY
ncbi:hypothetical protein LCGC14_0891820 [marine sediment metagenome]|uniref:Glycosyl transferase family 1 domain-containing protein n=1 Tax=marine sediment metagenome TaxID=412755 RepID=A0A0F9NYZ4_9ZZZZ